MATYRIRSAAGLAAFLIPVVLAGCSPRTPSGPPKTFARPAFSFTYPAAWAVDDTDEDYDPDHLFSIDASTGAMVMFVIADATLDPADVLAKHVTAQDERMTGVTKTDFTRWGKYDGRGTELRGRALGLSRSTVRIFVFTAGGKTFTVIEMTPDDETAQHAPGFRMVEDSFRVKE